MRFKAKPLRSVLFVPGNKEDWMRKAPQYGPDALILDLEDSVPEEGKTAVTFDGDMGDVAHEETAKTMLELVKQWGILN